MTKRLQGKIAVVTAAGQGIGTGHRRSHGAEGATVHATDVNRELLSDIPRVKRAKLDVLSSRRWTPSRRKWVKSTFW